MRSSSDRFLLAILVFTALGLTRSSPAPFAPDQLVFGPKQYLRTTGSPNEYTNTFTVPIWIGPPLRVHIVNGDATGGHRISSASVTLNGVRIAGPGNFGQQVAVVDRTVTLSPTNTLTVRVASTPGAYVTISVLGTKLLPKPNPTLTTLTPDPLTITVGEMGTLTATLPPSTAGALNVSSAKPSVATVPATVSFSVNQTSISIPVTAVGAGSAVITASLNGGSASSTVQVNPAPPPVPTEPPTVLTPPPTDPTVATDVAAATAFLYTGANPIQTGVAPGTIEPRRVAVLRGKVATRDGSPIPGVTISVLGYPELGRTLTRADGAFDIAVNGGGQLTLRYGKNGLLPVQRPIVAPWRDYAWLPDVVMIAADTAVTVVDLSVASMQTARGSPVSDADGARRATILFPPGTNATMVLPNGTTQPLTTLNVRATEYTVGASGPKAMPAPLPPSSGYTYAAELSVDEAVAAGATDVRFSQALPVYVENFLGFPVGTAVPNGYYDRQKGQWIASANGRVIEVLGVTSGAADLDTDGDAAADDAAKLATLGITPEEQARLAQLYTTGQTLWRVPITHFTPWDCNWPYGPPLDVIQPPPPDKNNPPIENPNEECGSVIGCQDQSLGESVPISGTPWRLHYKSDRAPGRREAFTLGIPVSGATIPASLRAIRVEVSIAGRLYQAAFAPAANATYAVAWDGKDGYGRPLQGAQPAWVQVHYDYAPQYYAVPSDFVNSFARAATAGLGIQASRGAATITLSKAWVEKVGAWDARALGLGGWSPSLQHAYDPVSRTVLLGDGRQRRAEALPSIITTVAGSGTRGFGGDGGPAATGILNRPNHVVIGPDGTLFIADVTNQRIRRVGPDGIITTVAGNGTGGFSGDDGPAVAAALSAPTGLAVGPDGSLFIADNSNRRIRRVGPDGIISTVAGVGTGVPFGFSGDGGPALAAGLNIPYAVAVGSDGSLFIADINSNRIRRVGPDGIITTVAGNGIAGFSGDGGPATAASLSFPNGVAVGPDGSLFITDNSNRRIRRVGLDGIITTVAGNGTGGFSGDGGPAVAAALSAPTGLAVGPDGSLFIADWSSNRIRRVGPDGIITTVAGNGATGFSGDGGPALAAQVDHPVGVAVGPDGSLYIVNANNNDSRVRRVGPVLPDFSISGLMLASEDGREAYFFNSSGRHLKTLDALTGAVRYQFGYASSGYLTSITDGSGKVSTIERTGAVPTAIVAPGGQRTALSVSADGWLVTARNPAAEAHTMSYSPDGLLQTFTDPRGNIHRFTYDVLGRLIKDEDLVGGSTTLSRTDQSNGYTVTTTSALGRTRAYQVERLLTGAIRRSVIQPSGAKTVTVIGTDGSEQMSNPDGSSSTVRYGPDPRWGMLAPVATSVIYKTPGGRTRAITTTRTATLSNPLDLSSLTMLTDTLTENGAVSTRVYDGTSRLLTSTTAAGRSSTLNLDALGRVTQEQIAALAPVSYAYDSRGLISTIAEGAGAASRTTSLVYNGARELTRVSDALGRSVDLAYDPAGRLVGQTLSGGRTLHYAYDAVGNATAITPPGRPAHGFAYTPVDQISSYTPPNVGTGSTATQYTYNADRALTRVTRPDGQAVDLTSDAAGRTSTLDFARGLLKYTYSSTTANLTGISAPGGIGLGYSHDGTLLTGVTWTGPVSGSVGYTYDNKFRLTAESVGGAHSVSFAYAVDDLLTTAGGLSLTRNAQNGLLTGTALGGVTDSASYNDLAELTDYSVAYSGSGLFSAGYARDAIGRITQKIETVTGATATYGYIYDAAGRLSGVTRNGTTVTTYTYDTNGNRTGGTGPGGTVSATYDNQDRLLTYGSAAYSHTANGELLSKTASGQITTYQYDALGNLTAAMLPGGKAIEYLIDGVSRRIGKKVNGTLVQGFLYQGSLRPVAELDGAGSVVSRFVYATRINVPDYMVKGGVTYRIITDHLGSPRLVLDVATGTVVQSMDYDEFGQVLSDTDPGFQPFGFAGGLYDRDTELVRFGARDYDAEIGRWTVKDPIGFAGGDENLYAYVWNDPVNFLDPIGLDGLPANFTPANLPDLVEEFFKKNPIFPPHPPLLPPSIRPGEGDGRGDTIGPCPGPTNLERISASARDRAWPDITKRRIADDLRRMNSPPMSRQPPGNVGPPPRMPRMMTFPTIR